MIHTLVGEARTPITLINGALGACLDNPESGPTQGMGRGVYSWYNTGCISLSSQVGLTHYLHDINLNDYSFRGISCVSYVSYISLFSMCSVTCVNASVPTISSICTSGAGLSCGRP